MCCVVAVVVDVVAVVAAKQDPNLENLPEEPGGRPGGVRSSQDLALMDPEGLGRS